jgi:diguanylate cyclase (GGDEF)-like protein/PAS domain S-box-containing protein
MCIFLFGPTINTNEYISIFFYNGDFIYNFSYLLLSILLIYNWGRKSKNSNQKHQSFIIALSSITPFVLNLITQTLLPIVGINFIPLMGQIYSLIMLWGVYYAIKTYQFMQIPSSLITTELFNEIMDVTFLIDVNGTITRINKKVFDLLGYKEKELINVSITNIIKEETFINLIDRCQLVTETIKLEHIYISTKEGISIPFDITINPLMDNKRHILLGILIIGQDITLINNLQAEIINHKITSEKLFKSEELFRTMIEMMPFAISLTSIQDDEIIYINSKMEELFNMPRTDVIGKSVADFYLNHDDRKKIIQQLRDGQMIKEKEIDFRRIDNTVFSGLLNVVNTIYNEQEVILACLSDTTEQRKLQQNIAKSEEMLQKLMNSIPDLVTVTDLLGNITFCNQSITILGYDQKNKFIPSNFLSIIGENDLERFKLNMEKMFFNDLSPVEYTLIKEDGVLLDVEINGSILRDKAEIPFGMIFVSRDITDRKRAQEEFKNSKDEIEKINFELLKTNTLLRERSIRDSLTNLYNHQHINELLDLTIYEANKKKNNLCLMMADIDFFKHVNDKFGHQVGDMVLVKISEILKINIRDLDLAGRYGGEEFIVILPNASLEEAYKIAETIRLSIQDYDFNLDNHKVTISIGLAQYQIENAKSFINRADTLLYQAKKAGRNRIQI